MNLQESIRRILKEDKKTKSTNKEFSKYKDSKFNSLRDYTLQDIVDDWDSLSDHKNENIKTIKHFINNPDKITDLVYDEKGLEDGYHRLIAAKILKKPRFSYRLVENLQESIRRVLREDRKNKFIMDTVDKHGVHKTAKMMGVSIAYLYKMSDLEIDEFVAKELLAENIESGVLPAKYKGFEIEITSDDVFYWARQFKSGHYPPNVLEKLWVMATPFFATADYTPVEVDWYGLEDDSKKPNVDINGISGDGDYFVELTHNTHKGNYFFNSVDDLFDWYNTFYLPGVYEIIMDEFIPKVQKATDVKLKKLKDENT